MIQNYYTTTSTDHSFPLQVLERAVKYDNDITLKQLFPLLCTYRFTKMQIRLFLHTSDKNKAHNEEQDLKICL